MAQVGLTDRLNQHAQRTGPVLGCAMALVLLVCMGTGIILYQRLDEYRSDIFGVPTVVQSVATIAPAGTPSSTQAPNRGATMIASQPTSEPAAPPPAAEATPSLPPAPRFRVVNTGGENLNVRAEPTTQSQVLARLPPGASVEDAGEEQAGQAGGQQVTWRKIRTSGGQVGWVPQQFLEQVAG